MIGKPDIKDLSLGKLEEWLAQRGIAAYRGGQILRWVYGRQVDTFEKMTDLSKTDREKLENHFTIGRLAKQKRYREIPIGMSIGLSMLHAGDDFKRLFKRVDQALYRAKHDGKHRVVIV